METALPIPDGFERYRSASQRARVATELWGARNLFCVECRAPAVQRALPNARARDLVCPLCAAHYEMKASSRPFGERVVDSGYEAMLASLLARRRPHLLLLEYEQLGWRVANLEIVPGFALTPGMVVPRRPLSPSARRGGWIGCNLDMRSVPPDARIAMIRGGRPAAPAQVRERFFRITSLLAGRPIQTRGWTLEVLRAVREIGGREFTLGDVYGAIPRLGLKYPDNHHPREKIRQQLQVLRDTGLLEFLGRGHYRAVNAEPADRTAEAGAGGEGS